ncbi:MAG: hypothetical protein SFZ23_13030 [Planctomycetota bacterium]|nr:hypothetical protein [Planctomycetota bacterium]
MANALVRRAGAGLAILVTLLVLNTPRALAQGTVFSSVPGVGPTVGWESPAKRAFLRRVDRLLTFRAGELPLMRTQVRHIAQDDAGSPTGGGGDGLTPANAWRCRDMSDVGALVSAFLASASASDTTILFRAGDVFWARNENTAQGIVIGVPHVSVGMYVDPLQPSGKRPKLLGFAKPEPIEAWTEVAPGVFERASANPVHWVRGRLAGSDEHEGYRDTPYVRERDAAAVLGTPHSFFFTSGTTGQPGVLRVNVGLGAGAHELGTLEACVARGAGVTIASVHDVRLDRLIIEGWGVDDPAGGNGCIRTSIEGTQTVLISGCDWGWSAYHGLLHSTPATGGILSLVDCAFGYHVNRSTAEGGGGDGAVSYAQLGGNEFYLVRCRSFGGGLSRVGVPGAEGDQLGMPVYMHTLGSRAIGMHVRKGCVFVPAHPTRARFGAYAAGNQTVVLENGAVTTFPLVLTDPQYFRAFIVDELAETDGGPGGGTWRCIDVNTRTITRIGPGGGNRYVWGTRGNSQRGLSINRDWEIRIDPAFSGFLFMGETTASHNHQFHHSRLRLTGGGALLPQTFFSVEPRAFNLDSCGVWNSVISNESSAASPAWNYPGADPVVFPYGGTATSGFFRFPPATSTWDSAPGNIALTAAASYPLSEEGRGLITPEVRAVVASTPTAPAGLTPEFDATGAIRRASGTTIGPLEAEPITCAADFNRDGVLDFFDYLDFARAFDEASTDADFSADGEVDFFDYLDFALALDEGC